VQLQFSTSDPSTMDPEYGGSDEEDAEAQAMAAAMGFSSFGSHKPAAKKRKFNPATDAYVEGEELASLDKGGKKGQGSGGNAVPLGNARVLGPSSKGAHESAERVLAGEKNKDEIALEDSDGDDEGPNYIDTSTAPPVESRGGYVQRHAPADSPPPSRVSEEEAREVQARIDGLLSSIGSQGAGDGTQTTPQEQFSRPTFHDTAFMLGGPRPPSSSRDGFNDASSAASSSRPSERGQRNPKWFVGYYDPSFNDNPWATLEQAKGLEPLGRWPERQGARAAR
jgi:hypothetical protein